MIIQLEKITKFYSGETVLDNIALTIENNDRIGLVGINGSGKSTLLRIITGTETAENLSAPNEPVIFKARDKTIGFLAQNAGLENSESIYNEMRGVFKTLDDTAARIREIEQNMNEKNAALYSKLVSYFEVNDGYLIDVKISDVLNGMGFAPNTYNRVISTLSGGEKTRLAMAKLLLEHPDLLILDEPTNHLDYNTIIWLEDYLNSYKGAFLIVSHDRYFLDKLTTSICEIERGKLRRFTGNYTAFVKQKTELTERRLKEHEAQQKQIAKLEDYIARNLVRASTSKMAKSRIKKLEAMERIDKPVIYEKSARIKFKYNIKPPLDVLTVRGLTVTAGSRTLIEGLNLNVRRGDKIGIVGANGTGKSMLLKTLLGRSGNYTGSFEWGRNVKISYFDQENAELNPNDTVIEAVHSKHKHMTEGEIRNLLALVRLTCDDVFKRTAVISGGERAKLSFALLMLNMGNTLVLDEPTNHLDIAAREVIETALESFDGTVIFVSHDRYLLNKLCTQVLEITQNGTYLFNGSYEAFACSKRNTAPVNTQIPEKKKTFYRDKEERARDAYKRGRVKELEQKIQELENLVALLDKELTEPEIYTDYEKAQEKSVQLAAAKDDLNKAADEWLELSE